MQKIYILLLLFVLFLSSTGKSAQRLKDAPYIEIEVKEPEHLDCVHPGYLEYVLDIKNNDKTARTIKLVCSNDWGGNLSGLSREVVVQGLATVSVPIYIPPAIACMDQMTVFVNGRKSGHVLVNVRNDQNYRSSIPVLVSRKIKGVDESYNTHFPHFSDKTSENERVSGKLVESFSPALTNVNINGWSKNWISYTGYSAVMLTANEFTSASDEVSSALSRYAETGGTIVIVGNYMPGEDYVKDNSDNSIDSVDVFYKGFGSLLISNKDSAENWEKKEWGFLASHWQRSSIPFKYRTDRGRSNIASSMPVVEGNQIPVKSLFGVVFIFAILVGPLNLFVFSRKEKRMRIYWIVPLCSIAATVVIVLVSVLSEGIDSRVRSASIVYLDENDNRASILSRVGYFCPLPPSELHFSNDIQLTCQTLVDNWDQGSGREIDYTEGQTYRNWVSARMAEYFVSRSSKICRDHIAARYDEEGNISVVNNLNGNIKRIMFTDSEGEIYLGNDITIGKAVDLEKSSFEPGQKDDQLRFIYSSNWSGIQKKYPETELVKWLKTGRYIAILETDNYSETGIENYRSTGQECIVFGTLNQKSLQKN